jgi:hypothetical protein
MSDIPLDVLTSWPSDWPTHSTKETLRSTLELNSEYLELIILLGNLQPDEEGYYSIQEFFQAARDHYEQLKKTLGVDAVCKLLEKNEK